MPAYPAARPLNSFPTRRSSDLLALLLALNSPEIEVRGISISYGNTVVENAYRNAVEIIRKVTHFVRVPLGIDRKSTRLNSSHANISYPVFCLTKKPTCLRRLAR